VLSLPIVFPSSYAVSPGFIERKALAEAIFAWTNGFVWLGPGSEALSAA
jgi:hypothetical protein